MKAYVITIMDNERSVEMAERCIVSCKRYGLTVEKWPAVTPRHPEFESLQKTLGVIAENFDTGWSRPENAIACFLSMASLWSHAVETNEDVLILEHDAVMCGRIPALLRFNKCMTLGKPSYGRYETPTFLGTGELTQKPYFGGAHSYIVSPAGAQELLETIPTDSRPTDVYLNINNFPWLEEYYPWCFFVNDSFSTIQHESGCRAKHNYDRGIELVEP